MKVLANDGLAAPAVERLKEEGIEVSIDTIAQGDLAKKIGDYDVLVVRSATKVTAEVLEKPGNLKLVIRAGVGMDNIDHEAAEERGVTVTNTPSASSLSVAELTIAHAFGLARHVGASNRRLPQDEGANFKQLKKEFSEGFELRGKTMGIIGFGRIGQEVAKLAIGLGMNVKAHNRTAKEVTLEFDHIPSETPVILDISTTTLNDGTTEF